MDLAWAEFLLHQKGVDPGPSVRPATGGRTKKLSLRRATEADSSMMLVWRNSWEVRRWSFNTGIIPAEAHRQWLRDCLADQGRHLLIGEEEGAPVGVLRIDSVGKDEAEIHIYLSPDCIGRGLGTDLLDLGYDWTKERLGVRRVMANVKPENFASVRAFENAGFKKSLLRMQRNDLGQ
jgi:RimJ/RimL family protein N-acetyltransferase